MVTLFRILAWEIPKQAWWATVHSVATSQTGLSTHTLIVKLLHVLIILVLLKSWFILNKKSAKDSYCILSFV